MIQDLDHLEDALLHQANFCIIGAGAAGITIAREFIGTQHTALVLESGGLYPEPQTQKLFESQVEGLPHTSIHNGRARILGGTTTLWGGQALRFDDFDFSRRAWVPCSGWPIPREGLDPYYRRAERVLHLDPPRSYRDLCSNFKVLPPDFDPEKLYVECSRWSPKPNFGTAYRQELNSTRNVTLLLHANVTAVVLNEAGTAVEHLELKSLSGKHGTAKARFYVICCGGIETARLLLASNQVQPAGVGNSHGLVGRYFQEHLHLRYGELRTPQRTRLQNLFESFFVRRRKHAPLVALSQKMQREQQLLSIHGTIIFEQDEDSAIAAAKTLFRAAIGGSIQRGDMKRLLKTGLSSPVELFGLAYRLYVQNRAGTPRQGPIAVGAQCEMAPNPDNRVLLDEARDQLGMPRVRLRWRVGEIERRTISRFIAVLAGEFHRLGLGSFDAAQVALLHDPVAWVHRVHDSAHHMGTTRMHESRSFGVVDTQCQVHGIGNLFIGSSSVFPTSARSNPTLTMLALCLRIADRLKQIA